MFSFECDYLQGCHPKILEALSATNLVTQPGYSNDIWCHSAAEKIKAAFDAPHHDVYFLTGGTQSNAVVIDSLTKPYEGVISADTGHVNVHEAGAIEHTGHKVLALPHHDGKLDAAEVDAYIQNFYADPSWTHMVKPGMVYVSHPTEYGTLYTAAELTALSEVCRRWEIPLFLDGARLGYGLMSRDTDVTPALLSQLCDVFYIGGTKVGALCGEAVVFRPDLMPAQFPTIVKQHGAMVAKGRVLGVQFDTLFTDGLYFEISKNAIDMAQKMKDLFRRKGYDFFKETPTNQQFVLLSDEQMARLEPLVGFSVWEKADATHTVVRFATSWATTDEDLKKLEERKPVVVCGDLNVAHQEIDLKNPKTNRKNAGFTDEERAKFSRLLEAGFTDTFRYFYPDRKEIYSW